MPVALLSLPRMLLLLLLLLLVQPDRRWLGEARISGFHIDYELCSGQLSATSNATSQQATCDTFFSALANLTRTLRAHSAGLDGRLALSVDAGTWMTFPVPGPSCMHIAFNGTTQSVAQHVVDLADHVQIMDYDTSAAKIVARAAPFFQYADKIGKVNSVVVGLAIAGWPEPSSWYQLEDEATMYAMMLQLQPTLEKHPSFRGFAVFDSVVWQQSSAHAPAPASTVFLPAATWGVGPGNMLVLNRTARTEWLSWAKTRRINMAYVCPHCGSYDLIPIPGVEGSAADAALFCEFVNQADAQEMDIELYTNGWTDRAYWDLIDLAFVHNCTVLTSSLRLKLDDTTVCSGAVGDGRHDDTPVLQRCLDTAIIEGHSLTTVVFPAGRYNVSALEVVRGGLTLDLTARASIEGVLRYSG